MKNRMLGIPLRAMLIFAVVVLPGLILLPTGCGPRQTAVQINISVVGDDLEEWRPTSVSVEKGGTVIWFNNGDEIHWVISSEGLWSDRQLSPKETFNFTFSKVGTYGYRDISDTFAGTVFVR